METEKRLVNANDIPLGKFVEPRTEYHQGWNDALDSAATQAPTVDAMEVVQCKDCKHWNVHPINGKLSLGKCAKLSRVMADTGYCSYGERRPDDH